MGEGTLNATLAGVTLQSEGGFYNFLHATMEGVTCAATGELTSEADRIGTLNQTLGASQLVATATAPVTGAATLTTGAATLQASAQVTTTGTMTSTLGNASLTATAQAQATATLDLNLGEAQLSALAITDEPDNNMTTLIKEDGTGKADANTYLLLEDMATYCAANLYTEAWERSEEVTQEAALKMATRLVDELFQFNGYKTNPAQALQWPRLQCPNPDITAGVPGLRFYPPGSYLDETKVPKEIINATAALALELLAGNRLQDYSGQGVSEFKVGPIEAKLDKKDKVPVIPVYIQHLLSKFGAYAGRAGGAVKLIRA